MIIALDVLAALLVFASVGSGFGKLKKIPQVMESMARVGVPANLIPVLATLEIAGGLGIVAGIWLPLLGISAAICLALYFLGAVLSHMRKKHSFADLSPALFILVIAIAVAVLEINR